VAEEEYNYDSVRRSSAATSNLVNRAVGGPAARRGGTARQGDGLRRPRTHLLGDHFEVGKALADDGYAQSCRDILEEHYLKCYAIGNHLVGQAVCDYPIDQRHRATLPEAPRLVYTSSTPTRTNNGEQRRGVRRQDLSFYRRF
jgi:hypothetical protein